MYFQSQVNRSLLTISVLTAPKGYQVWHLQKELLSGGRSEIYYNVLSLIFTRFLFVSQHGGEFVNSLNAIVFRRPEFDFSAFKKHSDIQYENDIVSGHRTTV